jgi:leucyl aminopeptidase
MKIDLLKAAANVAKTDLLAVAIFKDEAVAEGALAALDKTLAGDLNALITKRPDLADAKTSTLIYSFGRIPAEKILLVGLGERDKFDERALREFAGNVVNTANKEKAASIAIDVSTVSGAGIELNTLVHIVTNSAIFMDYNFRGYSNEEDKSNKLDTLSLLVTDDSAAVQQAVKQGRIYAESTNFARDLINAPANMMTPTILAEKAKIIADKHKLEFTVLDVKDMEKLGMGGILGVARGSEEPPKMIILKYLKGKNKDDIVGLVGKGLTFDSGGISLKPGLNMHEMKTDMSGGATVLAAIDAIAGLGLKENVICVIGATENMPSGKATKPGDVLAAMNGKTIEVLNTDAEGRVVLADCLVYAQKLGATRLIDVATLTGAMVVALGDITTGAMSNNQEFVDQFLASAEVAGERVWQMPLFPEYKEMIKSDIANVKNIGGRGAGSITAALFLEAFVDDVPWIHLDIAGSSWSEVDNNLIKKGSTGSMVRTIIQYVKDKK